ncbi:MAG TPA: amidohydrolase family protein [Candidatus Dormibacteraeota bacterium]|nr:amidohydrolase family protein [Candidatus Dormibacteraeota bacterium]
MLPRRVERHISLGMLVMCAVFCFAFAHPVAAQAGEPPYFAIRNARIVPVSGPVLENGTVVMSRGLIAAVGREVAIPAEALIIEGQGLTVYPGLIDAFTDLGLAIAPTSNPSPLSGAEAQRTATISRGPEDRPGTTPWRDAADELQPDDKRFESWRNAGFTTAVTAPHGGIFPGQAAIIDLAGERAGNLVVGAAVAVPVTLEPNRGFGNFPDSLMGVLAYVHQVWLDASWYSQADTMYEKHPTGLARPAYDRSGKVLARALRDNELVLIPANTRNQLLRAVDFPERWKVRGAIYGAQQAYELADSIGAKKLPVLVNLKWPEKEKDADPAAEESLRTLRFRDRAPSSPAALAKAGVKFAFYSGGITVPKDILKAAKKSIDAGLAPEVALRAFTLSAAEIFGVITRLGSIEPGKIANLVVTDGNLFEEKTKIKMVFVDGRKFEVHEPPTPENPPKGDISGKWKLSYTTPDGPEEGIADLAMESDGSVSGSFTSKRGDATISSGSVSGDKFNFKISLAIEGEPTEITLSGTFEKNMMKGTIRVSGLVIDFTGSRPGSSRSAAEN